MTLQSLAIQKMPVDSASLLKLSNREKAILCGLFLSRFDREGLAVLGFESFAHAFNVMGYSLRVKPASIKNYRDEFDPFFENPRVGRRNRPIRPYCKIWMDSFETISRREFLAVVEASLGFVPEVDPLNSSYAKRQITGRAAEQFFREHALQFKPFADCVIQDVTLAGCGFDFRLLQKEEPLWNPLFMAVEVKGLQALKGTVRFTAKEWETAKRIGNRYYLFIVKNFSREPEVDLFQDPAGSSALGFSRKRIERLEEIWEARI